MSDFPTDNSQVDGSAEAAARQQRFFARFLNEIPDRKSVV